MHEWNYSALRQSHRPTFGFLLIYDVGASRSCLVILKGVIGQFLLFNLEMVTVTHSSVTHECLYWRAGETLGGMGDLQLQRGLPGIGEFQCYDKYMMESLRQAAEEVNEEEWCVRSPLFPAWSDLLVN